MAISLMCNVCERKQPMAMADINNKENNDIERKSQSLSTSVCEILCRVMWQ